MTQTPKQETSEKAESDGGVVLPRSEAIFADEGSDYADSAETVVTRQSLDKADIRDHPIQIDQVFEILKNQRRRSVLRYMRSVDDEVRLGALAEQIAAWECDKPVDQITSGERKRVYVGLYQSHLPKMDDVGAISYNKPRGKIAPGEHRHLFNYYLPGEDANSATAWNSYHWLLLFVTGLVTVSAVLLWILA